MPSSHSELDSVDVIWQHLWRTCACATPTDAVCQVLVLLIPRQFVLDSTHLAPCILHLAVNFEDGVYIGEVVVIMDVETVKNKKYPQPLMTSPLVHSQN